MRDTFYRHPDPVALVEEFARRDAEGPFERAVVARSWHDNALGCVDRNTSDHYEVITAFYVEALRRRPDTTLVLVRRTRVFELAREGDGRAPRLVPAPRDWVDTVVVVRTRHGWRIHRLHPGAHRFPSRALAELPELNEDDRERLRRLGTPGT